MPKAQSDGTVPPLSTDGSSIEKDTLHRIEEGDGSSHGDTTSPGADSTAETSVDLADIGADSKSAITLTQFDILLAEALRKLRFTFKDIDTSADTAATGTTTKADTNGTTAVSKLTEPKYRQVADSDGNVHFERVEKEPEEPKLNVTTLLPKTTKFVADIHKQPLFGVETLTGVGGVTFGVAKTAIENASTIGEHATKYGRWGRNLATDYGSCAATALTNGTRRAGDWMSGLDGQSVWDAATSQRCLWTAASVAAAAAGYGAWRWYKQPANDKKGKRKADEDTKATVHEALKTQAASPPNTNAASTALPTKSWLGTWFGRGCARASTATVL